MGEYEARIKSFANGVSEIRSATGATSTTLMFALMSVLLSKNKITDRDLEIIFDVENKQAYSTMQGYFDQNYGDPDFEIQNEEELKEAYEEIKRYITDIKNSIRGAADNLKPPKRKKESKGEN
jgi:hypothetical protein